MAAPKPFKDKVVLITGASSGIGKALAERYGRAGAKLVIGARSVEALQKIADSLRNLYNTPVEVVRLDVTSPDECTAFVQHAVTTFGRIDVLINNAGITMRALFEDGDIEAVRRVMEVNFFGVLNCTQPAMPYLKKSKGSVVGVSSIAGHRGLPGRTAYSSSKFALQGFMEVLRTEMLPHKVHVLAACPGFTASNIRKNALDAEGGKHGETYREEEKMMTAEEVADHIFHSVRKRKRDLILTTQGKLAVFVNKWLPRLADRLVYKNFTKEKDAVVQ